RRAMRCPDVMRHLGAARYHGALRCRGAARCRGADNDGPRSDAPRGGAHRGDGGARRNGGASALPRRSVATDARKTDAADLIKSWLIFRKPIVVMVAPG